MPTRRFLLTFVVAALLPILAEGQTTQKIDNDFVQRTFGKDFTMVQEVGGMVGDMDGDGVEDVVIAARCKNPLLDQAEHDYGVIDPYYTFFGYGDPKVTMSFVEDSPSKRGLVVLIIRTISVRKMRMKKKTLQAIYAEEGNELSETSALFFDGKNYKYVPMGSSME